MSFTDRIKGRFKMGSFPWILAAFAVVTVVWVGVYSHAMVSSKLWSSTKKKDEEEK